MKQQGLLTIPRDRYSSSNYLDDPGSVISLLGVGSGSGYLGGDTEQTDGPFEFELVSGGCVTGFVTSPKFGEIFPTLLPTLNPGSSCALSMIVTAPSHADLIPEDKDSGVWDVNAGVLYTCDGCGDLVGVNSLDKIVTVEDQLSSSVPEPSVLLLLATGLLGVSAAARRNLLSA